MNTDFRALKMIGSILKFLGIVGMILGLVSLVVAPLALSNSAVQLPQVVTPEAGLLLGLFTGVLLFFLGVAVGMLLFALGECFNVLIAIEANTRQTAVLLEKAAKKEK